MTLISAAVATAGFLSICLLIRRFPDMDLAHMFEQALGARWASSSPHLAATLFYIAATRLSDFTEVLRTYVYSYSPVGTSLALRWPVWGSWRCWGWKACPVLKADHVHHDGEPLCGAGSGSENYKLYHLEPIAGYGFLNTIQAAPSAPRPMRKSSCGGFARPFRGSVHPARGTNHLLLSGIIIGDASCAFR
jgi:hypothetical protein